jgi:hypothetical protein
MKIIKDDYLVIDLTEGFGQSSVFGPFKNKTECNKFIKEDFDKIKNDGYGCQYLIMKIKETKEFKGKH